MKTPSSLPLLLLFAALPAAASELKPPARCDAEFLNKVVNDYKAGGLVEDARIAPKTVGALTVSSIKFADPKTCDAATWRHLASGTPLVWRSADLGKYWDARNAGYNAAVLLVADDFFKTFDAKADAVLKAADAVIAAGVQLGVVTTADSPKTLAELLPGASGGPFAGLKPKTVAVVAEAAQTTTLAPEQVGPAYRKLLDETGAARAGGETVKAFRLAVLEFNQAIGGLGAANAAVTRRLGVVDLPALKDFSPGLPAGYTLPKAGEHLVDAKYDSALGALVGAGAVPALNDAAARAGSLLEPADLGVRNLVAIRASEVDRIVALAKEKLKGKSITQVEAAMRAAGLIKTTAPNSLAAAVFTALAQTPEYARLDALFENNSKKPGWAESQEGKDVIAAREAMKAAALSAGYETINGKKEVVFTPQGGKKIVLGSLVPSSVENDAAVRSTLASAISDLIVDGALNDAKTKAVVAAVAGDVRVGGEQPLSTNLKPAEAALARDLPPASKKIKDGAAGCDNPKDLVRNDYETYAARQRAAATQLAGSNVRSRNDVEAARVAAVTAANAACKQRKDAVAAIKQGYFDDASISQDKRTRAAAEAEAACAADLAAIEAAAKDKLAALTANEVDVANPAALTAKADADLAAAFAVAISASIEKLRTDYTTAGSPRLRKLTALTGDVPELLRRAAGWFATEWPNDAAKKAELEAAVAACAKELGLVAGGRISYKNPDNPDNVDKHCKVNEKLTAAIIAGKGSNRLAPEVK